MIKTIAFYLPQFHTIAENDEWWGKGFTEWTNTKKAKPLFAGQYQPREPLNDNYYDLSDVDVMKWQSKIAQEYGVYGFCYYHYWFNGKKLLEKPLENMLKDKEVDIPFCFSWANEPWSRTWDGKETDVLMPQEYGEEKDWKEHFDYLLDFFRDERYIKIDNKPMMVIYRTMDIPNVEDMCRYWDSLAIKNGFKGLYIVETLNGKQHKPSLKISEAAIEFEPTLTMSQYNRIFFEKIINRFTRKIYFNGLRVYSYDKIWSNIFRRDVNRFDKKLYLGGFVDWDNTARRGTKGNIYKGSTPEKFAQYVAKQIERSNINSFIFINAWNEWAEGAYLEPDKRYEFKYLEALKKALNKLGMEKKK